MKYKELKAMTELDLNGKLAELRKEHMKNSAQRALGASIKNPGKIREVRKTIAKITMLLGQKTTDVPVTKIKKKMQKGATNQG